MTEKNVIGKCPVCGGDVMESPLGFCCNGTTKEGRRCQFVIHRKMHGVEMTEEICSQLLSEGRAGIMEMKNKKNQPFTMSPASTTSFSLTTMTLRCPYRHSMLPCCRMT